MGACCDRLARCVMPFGCTFVISLPAVLISHFRSFSTILPTYPTSGWLKRLVARVWSLNAKLNALKKVGLNKSQGLDSLPYEVYLRLPHTFAQGAVPGSVTKGVITLLKKGGRHVWESLEDYRPITLLNIELKVLARVLGNCLQLVLCDLIGPEQTFAVKGISIQNNLHLIRGVLEGIEDRTEAALISLDESKAFDRVDHRFLTTVLEIAGFQLEFSRWISMMYHNPQAVV